MKYDKIKQSKYMLLSPLSADGCTEGKVLHVLSYLELNLGCVVIMLVILRVHIRSLDKSAPARVFTSLLLSMMIYSCFDLLCGLIENHYIPTNHAFSTFANVCFFFSSHAVAYLSFVYAEHEMERPWIFDARKRMLVRLPLFALIILTLLTLKFKFYFYIDEQGNYIKGAYYIPMLVLAYGYIIAVGVDMLILSRDKHYYTQRKKLLTLGSFVFFPLLAGAIQSMFTGVSLICFGGTIAMVQVFINLQETRITLDPLTKINNRTRLMQVLEMNMADEKQPLYFVMLDVDNFKAVNDKYGHLEGDTALIAVSRILMQVCGSYHGILARFGGDEFSVVLLPPPHEDRDDLIDTFRAQFDLALQKYNAASTASYSLGVSLGWAKRSDTINTIPLLIEAADKSMYENKKQRKAGR